MINRLKAELKTAMIEKDTIKKNIIQMVRSNLQNYARDNKKHEVELTQEEINVIIMKELKQQRDSLEAFEKGNREDLARETRAKIEILENYLPKQLTAEEIEVIVKETLNELGIEVVGVDKGKVMKLLMPKVKGKANGKLVNEVVSRFK